MTPEEFIALYPDLSELVTKLVDDNQAYFAERIFEAVVQNAGFAYMAEYIAGHYHIIPASHLLTYYMSLIANL